MLFAEIFIQEALPVWQHTLVFMLVGALVVCQAQHTTC